MQNSFNRNISHIDGKICNRTQQKRMLYLALLIRHKETVDYFICRKTHSCCSVERWSYRFGCFLVLFFSILFQTYIWFEANELKTNFVKLISKIVYRRSEFISVYKIESCNLYSIVHHGTRLLFLPPCSCTPSLCWRRHNNWITLQHNYKIAFCLQHFSLSERSQIHVLEEKNDECLSVRKNCKEMNEKKLSPFFW